ncbi:hypothetical protein AOQ84DRAFT_370906 [Glonium stellatum]|uniref:Uncharacterized protein n=1 Tax=Glonium stellatum TaxID=574774 RepID=A0A8E2FCX1_9PEZI|nr:hypothetical protein AOQ84DRAFT_370906 [Glonium stellatum]
MAPRPTREQQDQYYGNPHITTTDFDESEDDADQDTPQGVPIHPLSSMQGPFEESMLDSTGETDSAPFKAPNMKADVRHQVLCKIDSKAHEVEWNFTYNCYWRNNPKGKFHPLLKTLAQITFGVHLLHQHLERSVSDVADILLKHVHELDSFLQRANEDIESSIKDMLFRRNCLKVPMEHVSEFDRLLEDRQYRAQLLEGNDTIERTIFRMSQMMNDYLVDITTFKNANSELGLYLGRIGDEWTEENEDVERIYAAMCGNTLGWGQFLQNLTTKAEKLGVVLVQVGSYCNEIEKRCGAASRRSLIASRSSSRNSNSRDASRSFRSSSENKPLPTVPSDSNPVVMVSPPRSDSVRSTSHSQSEKRNSHIKKEAKAAGIAVIPVDDGSVGRDAFRQENTAELAKFIRTTGPSGSNATNFNGHILGKDTGPEARLRVPGEDDSHDLEEEDKAYDGRDKVPHSTTHRSHLQSSDNGTGDPSSSKPSARRGRVAANGEGSPPLTAQDSAYSSVSAGSFASPAVSQPPLLSPRVTLGLFPSSMPQTPKFSPSGRNGSAIDLPTYTSSSLPDQRSRSQLGSRGSASNRLLKKPSLSSLKKFFTRKKTSQPGLRGVDGIKE